LTIFATRRSIFVKSSIEISGASSSMSPASAAGVAVSVAAGAARLAQLPGRARRGDGRLVEQVLDHLRVHALHQVAVGADGAAEHLL
jgi:hypothetical protein